MVNKKEKLSFKRIDVYPFEVTIKGSNLIEYPCQYDESNLLISNNTFGLMPCEFYSRISKRYQNDIDEYYKSVKRKLSGRVGFVYALVSPFSNKPFYIGKTTGNISDRLRQHLYGKGSNLKKEAYIQWIIRRGYKPKIELICTCPIEFLREEEKRWIWGNSRKLTNLQCN